MIKPLRPMDRILKRLLRGQIAPTMMLLFCLGPAVKVCRARSPEEWIPARWDGGPLEVARHSSDKALTANGLVREVIANWYSPATLGLLEGSPINCLLVT